VTSKRKYGFATAISIVIANMVGTGVFTSLGFQLVDIGSPFVILLLWTLGGVAAFCGAVSYAELGAALPRSGGEYQFVSRIYHPAAGFVSGWVSVSIGFAAPTALAAMTFAAYATSAVADDASDGQRQAVACALIVALALVHGWRRRASGGLQTVLTLFKVVVIVAFCAAAFLITGGNETVGFLPRSGDVTLTFSSAFAVSLIYVSFAYTGWNVATYLTGEIAHARRNLPLILGLGTFVVTVLYVGLNAAFLAAAPFEAMAGKIEVGFIAARAMFGEGAGDLTAIVMASLLISTVSAMTIAGPRVLQVIGEDYSVFRPLARTTREGVPRRAIYLQSALAIVFILSAQFESVLVLSGSLVAMNSFFTVLGLYVLRFREPELDRPYKAFAYPIAPAIYLVLTGSALVFGLAARPMEGAFVLGVIAAGAGLYLFIRPSYAS
jgi:APA family basic amino acid/polyamine antiporter